MKFEIREQNGKKAIFKDGKRITDWFNEIYSSGLIEGKSEFFIARKGRKHAIYRYKDGKTERITDWYDRAYSDGLIQCQSEFFVAKKDDREAIYRYKDGKVEQITDWFVWVWVDGLVLSQSEFFVAKKDRKYETYHKLLKTPVITGDMDLSEYTAKPVDKLPLLNGNC